MRNITARLKKTSKTTKNAEESNTPVDDEENAKKRNKVSKPAEAELLKSFVFKDLDELMGGFLKSDVNFDGPMRVFKFDYGDRENRNVQWVQYMKPEIISKCLILPKSRGIFCAKVFTLVFISLMIAGSIAATTWAVPKVAVVLKGITGLGLLMGSIFLFWLTFALMCMRFSIWCPWNLMCYISLNAATSIICGVLVAHSGAVEIALSIAVIAVIIFIFFIMAVMKFDFTEPYFYEMAVTLVLFLFTFGIYIISGVMRWEVTLLYMFMALTVSIFYVICIILQVQMILSARGIELTKKDWLFAASTVFISMVFVFKNILQMIHEYNLI